MAKNLTSSQSSVIISNSYDELSKIGKKTDDFLAGISTDSDDESVFEGEGNDTIVERDKNRVMEELNSGKSTAEILLPHIIDISNKLNKLTQQVAHPTHGLRTKVKGVENQADDNTARIDKLEKQNQTLIENQRIMIGIIQKQAEEIDSLKSKQEDLTARSMKENIVLHNWDYEVPKGENANPNDLRPVILKFIRDKLEVPADERELYVAHKLGENSIVHGSIQL